MKKKKKMKGENKNMIRRVEGKEQIKKESRRERESS